MILSLLMFRCQPLLLQNDRLISTQLIDGCTWDITKQDWQTQRLRFPTVPTVDQRDERPLRREAVDFCGTLCWLTGGLYLQRRLIQYVQGRWCPPRRDKQGDFPSWFHPSRYQALTPQCLLLPLNAFAYPVCRDLNPFYLIVPRGTVCSWQKWRGLRSDVGSTICATQTTDSVPRKLFFSFSCCSRIFWLLFPPSPFNFFAASLNEMVAYLRGISPRRR